MFILVHCCVMLLPVQYVVIVDQCWIGTHFFLTFVPTPTCMHDPSWMLWPLDDLTVLPLPPSCGPAARTPSEAPVSDAATSLPPPQIHSTLDTAGQSGICLTADATLQLLFTSFCLQTSLKLSTTGWMHDGSSLVPIYVWSTISGRSLTEVKVADQKTVCWNCWTGGCPKRTERGPFLAHGRL